MPEVHRQVCKAHCRVRPRARVGGVRVEICQETSQFPWKRHQLPHIAQMEMLHAQVNSLCQWSHSTNAQSGSFEVGQVDAGSSELQSAMNCGRRCFTTRLFDRWNGDVKAKPSMCGWEKQTTQVPAGVAGGRGWLRALLEENGLWPIPFWPS